MTFEQVNGLATPLDLDDNGELLKMVPLAVFIDALYPDRVSKSRQWHRHLPRVLPMQVTNASPLHHVSRWDL